MLLKNIKNGKYELTRDVMDDNETVEKVFKKAIKKDIGLERVALGDFINTWLFNVAFYNNRK